jgi:undecaprenyl-diphosphatase
MTEEMIAKFGIIVLIIVGILESIVLPLPSPDMIIIPLVMGGKNPWGVAFLATASSVFGAVIAYHLGRKYGRRVAERFLKKEWINSADRYYGKYGAYAIFISALTPIPYKVFCWTGGIFNLKFERFLIASIIGRGLRFYLVAGVFKGMWEFAKIII